MLSAGHLHQFEVHGYLPAGRLHGPAASADPMIEEHAVPCNDLINAPVARERAANLCDRVDLREGMTQVHAGTGRTLAQMITPPPPTTGAGAHATFRTGHVVNNQMTLPALPNIVGLISLARHRWPDIVGPTSLGRRLDLGLPRTRSRTTARDGPNGIGRDRPVTVPGAPPVPVSDCDAAGAETRNLKELRAGVRAPCPRTDHKDIRAKVLAMRGVPLNEDRYSDCLY